MVRVAIVGAGHWGPNLINNFHTSKRSSVSVVVDRDGTRLAAVAQRFAGMDTSQSFDDMLERDDVDAVVIATPTTTHYDLASAALEAGKHVLVEKPLTDGSKTSLALCEQATRVDKVLMVGHVFVFNAAERQVKEYLSAGELGRIYYISMVRTNLGPIRVDVDASWDLAAHDISLANFWLEATPISVFAQGGSWINSGIADAVFATLRYPGEILVNLHVSWLNPRKERNITVVGDQQMLTFDDVNLAEPLRIYDKQVVDELTAAPVIDSFSSFRMSVRDGDIRVPKVVSSEPLRNECEHFLDRIIDDAPPLAGGTEGLAVVRTLDAISLSLRENGREVMVED